MGGLFLTKETKQNKNHWPYPPQRRNQTGLNPNRQHTPPALPSRVRSPTHVDHGRVVPHRRSKQNKNHWLYPPQRRNQTGLNPNRQHTPPALPSRVRSPTHVGHGWVVPHRRNQTATTGLTRPKGGTKQGSTPTGNTPLLPPPSRVRSPTHVGHGRVVPHQKLKHKNFLGKFHRTPSSNKFTLTLRTSKTI